MGALLSIWIIVCVAAPPARAQQTPPPAASRPTHESVAERLHRLSQIAARDLSRIDAATRVALEFCVALGAADGPRAAAAVDAIGYQNLPLEGRLPEAAQKPLRASEVAEVAGRRPHFEVGGLPASAFEVLSAPDVPRSFPAAAQWMIPTQDLVVRISPVNGVAGVWVTRPACLVIRMRGSRATIVGGSLVEALGLR